VLRQVIDVTLPTLHQMKREGLVRAVGLGVNDSDVVLEVLRETDLDALLLAGRYSLLDHGALAELLPTCVDRGVHVALGGVFNSGILATGAGAGAPKFDYAPATAEWLARTRRIESHCAAHRVPLRAAALQFPLAHPAIEIVVAGARSVAEWNDCAAMMAHPVPAPFWSALRARGLLAAEAPLPGEPR
jgi:D-threo-aldose 1-dehydrogenase